MVLPQSKTEKSILNKLLILFSFPFNIIALILDELKLYFIADCLLDWYKPQMNQNPEQIARDHIDWLLTDSGWLVHS